MALGREAGAGEEVAAEVWNSAACSCCTREERDGSGEGIRPEVVGLTHVGVARTKGRVARSRSGGRERRDPPGYRSVSLF